MKSAIEKMSHRRFPVFIAPQLHVASEGGGDQEKTCSATSKCRMDAMNEDAQERETYMRDMMVNDNVVHGDVIREADDVLGVVEEAAVHDVSIRINASGPASAYMQSHSFNVEQEDSSMEPYDMFVILLPASSQSRQILLPFMASRSHMWSMTLTTTSIFIPL